MTDLYRHYKTDRTCLTFQMGSPHYIEEQRVTFMTASVCSSSQPTKACPDSWKATTLCSSLDRILLFFTLPEDTHTNVSDCVRVVPYTNADFFISPDEATVCLNRRTCYHSLHCILKVKGIDGLVTLSGSMQGSLVANVSNVRTCRDEVSWQQDHMINIQKNDRYLLTRS